MKEDDPKNGGMQQVQVVLNNLMRMLCGTKRKDKVKIAELMEHTKIPSANHLCTDGMLAELYRAEKFGFNLKQVISPITKPHEIELRSKKMPTLPPYPESRGGIDLHAGVKLWNEILGRHNIKITLSNHLNTNAAKQEFERMVSLLPI